MASLWNILFGGSSNKSKTPVFTTSTSIGNQPGASNNLPRPTADRNQRPTTTNTNTSSGFDTSKLVTVGSGVDLNSLVNNQLGGASSAYNQAVAAARPIDLTPMINAYNQAAQAQKDTANQTYQSKRQDLLTSIKRFQEQNALQQQQQRQDYLSTRADLEDARYQADRATMIDAASRGISGSGLQQLSQLQNLIAQGREVSENANANQQAMDALRTALREAQEDTDKSLNDILNEYNLNVQSIDANTANLIAQLEYNERVRQEEARQQAASLAASLASQRANAAATQNAGINALNSIVNDAANQLKRTNRNDKNTMNEIYDAAMDTIAAYQEQYNLDNVLYNQAATNLGYLIDYYKNYQ